MKNYANHNQVRKDMIRRLACSNFQTWDKFITFTFAENKTDLQECNLIFKNFIKRLKYHLGVSFKYLAVIEFQKRGAIHYHALMSIPYIESDTLSELWGQGYILINNIYHVDNLGAYIVKYMCKDSDDTRLMGQKAYLYSRDLIKPTEFSNGTRKKFTEYVLNEDKLKELESLCQPRFIGEYSTEFLGKCNYKQYNLGRFLNEDK